MRNLFLPIFALLVCSLVNTQSPYRPKTTSGAFCAIPFEYNGKYYHDCTTDGSSSDWCRIKDSWGYCTPKPNFASCEVAPPTTSPDDVKNILELVNNIRAGEPALRMAKLRWNSELAQRAQFMSNQCQMGNKNSDLCTSKEPMGQMSYVTKSTQPQAKKWGQFILEFFKMKSSYVLETNTCNAQYCNGYKQLVNAETTEIGCAVTSCNETKWYADYYFCNFYPPIYSGRPYEKGEARCDSCYKLGDHSFRCSNNLCEICDAPSSDCFGKEQLEKEIESGKVCADLDSNFCETNASVCAYIEYLPAEQKAMMKKKCRKTCAICK